MPIPTNALGIMFVRIDKGESTRDNMGDWLVQQRMAQSISTVTEMVHKYGGIVGKTFDNAVLSTFPKADKASKAAQEIQQALFADSSESTVTQAPMEIRITLNHGKMIVAAGNVAGPEIDIVVQLSNTVEADQILATEAFINALGKAEKGNTRSLGSKTLEGMQSEMTLHEVIWTESDLQKPAADKTVSREKAPAREEPKPEAAAPAAVAEAQPAEPVQEDKKPRLPTQLLVTYKGQEFTVDASHPELSIGRKAENDIVIDQAYVSRKHAVLAHGEDGFVLKNLGANGVRIFLGNAKLGERCREEMPLTESGRFTLGPPLDEAADEVISFTLA